jgi:hypothetical protein
LHLPSHCQVSAGTAWTAGMACLCLRRITNWARVRCRRNFVLQVRQFGLVPLHEVL